MKVIGFDLGGTKLAGGVVDQRGRMTDFAVEYAEIKAGWPGVLDQLSRFVKNYREMHKDIKAVGIASAGPLDSDKGVLLDPTNYKVGNKTWGKIEIVKDLKKKIRMPVYLENDAAAAVLAEGWTGSRKKSKNILVLTLGTGLGVGVIANGELLRGGRGLHPEAGHILLDPSDRLLRCGCGVYGCAEAFLAGKKFEERASLILKEPGLRSPILRDRAKSGDAKVKALFVDYGKRMAQALLSYIVLYYPEEVVLTGGFAEGASLFLPTVETELKILLERRLKTLPLMPTITASKFQNQAGVIGAAYVAMHGLKK